MKRAPLFLAAVIALALPSLASAVKVTFPGTSMGDPNREFIELSDGNFGVAVDFHFYVTPRSPFTHSVFFAPTDGVIHLVGKDLVWSVNGRDTVIAHKEWWYSIYLPQPDVFINVRAVRDQRGNPAFNEFDVSAELAVGQARMPFAALPPRNEESRQ